MYDRLRMIRSQIATRLPYFLHSGCKWSSKIDRIGHFGERQRVVASADSAARSYWLPAAVSAAKT